MAPAPQTLRPQPLERGLASWEPSGVADVVTPAWDGLLELAEGADLDAQTRLPGWTVRHVLVHLGRWDGEDHRMERMEADARASRVSSVDDEDARNARLVAAHHDAPRAEILAALAAGRDRVLEFLAMPDAAQVGRRSVGSPVGPLPLTSVVVAQCYELAVHALDIADATSGQVPGPLLHAGVGALTEVAGAVSARSGAQACLAVVTSHGCWATGSDGNGAWITLRLGLDAQPSSRGWPTVSGSAEDVLEAASGRALAVQMLATRRLRVSRPLELVRLLPALRGLPGVPGGSALEATLQTLGQTGRLVGRLSSGVRDSVGSALRR